MTPMRVDFPYLMADTDRHGNRRTTCAGTAVRFG